MIDKCLKRIEQMDQLIRQKATGSPRQLAIKIGLSERMIYEYLDVMKEWGAPIEFNTFLRSYCYAYEVKFSFGFEKNEKMMPTAI